MARRRSSRKDDTEKRPRRGSAAGSFLLTLLIIFLIAYIGLLIASRTEGFKVMFTERIAAQYDLPMTVERMWLKPNLTLVLEDVRSLAEQVDGTADLTSAEWQMSWHPWRNEGLRILEMRETVVHFRKDMQGTWQPAIFAAQADRLAALIGAPPLSDNLVRNGLEPLDWDWQDAELFWLTVEGHTLMSLQGVRTRVASATLVERTVQYQEVFVERPYWQNQDFSATEWSLLWVDGRPMGVPR